MQDSHHTEDRINGHCSNYHHNYLTLSDIMHLSANWEIGLFNEKLNLNLVCEMKVLFRHHHLHHYMLIIITMGGHIENVTIVTLDMVVVNVHMCGWLC